MYILIAGGGKVGANLARTLLKDGKHEVTLIEQRRDRFERLSLPEGSRLISIMRNGRSEIAVGSTQLEPGDQVLAILQPGKEDELRRVLLKT